MKNKSNETESEARQLAELKFKTYMDTKIKKGLAESAFKFKIVRLFNYERNHGW